MNRVALAAIMLSLGLGAGVPAAAGYIAPSREALPGPERAAQGCDQASPCRLTVTVMGSGTVTSKPAGIDCSGDPGGPDDCKETFTDNTRITLIEAPDTGATFRGWGGACSGTSGTCIVSISGDTSASATFSVLKQTLSVSKTGNGSGAVTSSPAGIDCGGTCSASFQKGTRVTLMATPDANSTFGGWSGACSGTGSCTVTLNSDELATATFALSQPKLTVSKTGNGQGTVTSDKGGIDCGSTCSASFAQGTTVALFASPDSSSTFDGWSGPCSGKSTCTVTMDSDKTVMASFSLMASPPPPPGPSPPPAPPAPPSTTPQIGDPGVLESPRLIPVTTANPADTNLVAELAAGVNGNGLVVQGSARALAAREAAPLSCGFNQFSCYTHLKPAQKIVLIARPLAGYVFRAWAGACAGQRRQCTVVAQALKTVTAIFAPRVITPSVGFDVRPTSVSVRWQQSAGSGRIVVSGAVGGAASIRVQVRRPGGGPLVGKTISAKGGQFRSVLPLNSKTLPRGAKVLPGGFVASVTGLSRASKLPFHLRPVVIPAPAEGVVRRTFASALKSGPATPRLPRKSSQAWAHFRFATQPSSRLPVTVAWYWPNGKLLGAVKKSNRPEIVSFLRLGSGLPSGSWVAELRAGKKVVKRLAVRIG